ncbi:vacuolar amino acid transporter 1-like [Hordeum vulgare]|nr:vacuolar amino acid transporter 1-like [Hordeum vulgare]
MAILGYLMYGDYVESQVTLNLPEGKLSSKLAIYIALMNPFSKYALMVTPVAIAIKEKLLAGNKRSLNMLIRTFIVISTTIVALTVPFFGHIMALVGSLLGVMASMLLPCICYLKIFVMTRCSRVEVALIVMIIILGSLVAASGTYSSLQKIIHEAECSTSSDHGNTPARLDSTWSAFRCEKSNALDHLIVVLRLSFPDAFRWQPRAWSQDILTDSIASVFIWLQALVDICKSHQASSEFRGNHSTE